jgi:hypothetical protein
MSLSPKDASRKIVLSMNSFFSSFSLRLHERRAQADADQGRRVPKAFVLSTPTSGGTVFPERPLADVVLS